MKILHIDGKPVVDAVKKMVLNITAPDIMLGRGRKPDTCAAAVACCREFGVSGARVHLSRVYLEYPKKWVRYETPQSLRTEIVSFDRGHRFETGAYTLLPLRRSLRSGTPRGRGKSKTGVRKLKPHKPVGARDALQSGMYS